MARASRQEYGDAADIIIDANRKVTGVRHAWTFDEMYSAMAVQGLDANNDGVFSPEELKPLTDVNINSLKEFDYFTFVHVGDTDALPLKAPENASLEYDKSLLTLRFTMPLDKPLNAHNQEVQVDVYDPSFFVAFGGSFFAVAGVFPAAVLVVDDVVDFAAVVLVTFDVVEVVAVFAVELTFEPALSRSRLTLLVTELTCDLTPEISP